jgi:hypothetical protein
MCQRSKQRRVALGESLRTEDFCYADFCQVSSDFFPDQRFHEAMDKASAIEVLSTSATQLRISPELSVSEATAGIEPAMKVFADLPLTDQSLDTRHS